MKTQKIVLLATLLAVLAWDMQKPVWSCGGTPVPNCGRTMWLALLTPRNIVFRAGVPIQVPVGVMPYLFWNVNAPCAQPAVGASAPGVSTPASIFNNASLIINVTCTPLGGSPVQLGPFIYNFDLPAMPGIQPNDSVSFDVPAGTFDGSVPVICDVSGTYAVDFTNGTGAGMLSASNQTEVCIVPPSADDVNLPRLDFKYIPKQGGLFERLRRGDQGYFYFLASNNDLRNSVELNLTTNLDSRGNLPDGFNPGDPAQAYQSLVYSTQDLRGDFYTHNFVDNPADWQALPYGDPQNNPTSLNKTITLKAGQS
ncbi:MAG TPA: hypothetical protein VGA99_01840, partial [bacterium]